MTQHSKITRLKLNEVQLLTQSIDCFFFLSTDLRLAFLNHKMASCVNVLYSISLCVLTGLRDILHMISHQWQELQRQIRRQHNWMLRTLDAIKTHILSSERDEEERETRSHHGSPKVQPNVTLSSPLQLRIPSLSRSICLRLSVPFW